MYKFFINFQKTIAYSKKIGYNILKFQTEVYTTMPGTIIMIVVLVGLFYFMYRSNKKQERETNLMRSNLEVGDEITTAGGIIGEIVKIKDETVTIETGKDRTKIRILRSAVRNVDVHAYEKRGDGKKPEDIQLADGKQKNKVKDMNGNENNETVKVGSSTKKKKKKVESTVTENAVEEPKKDELEVVSEPVEAASEEKAE